MKVQLISQNVKKIDGFCCSTISAPQALDGFDINIIFLTDNSIWESKSKNKYPLLIENELINLCYMINNSNKTNVIIVLPQDLYLRYDYGYYSGGYRYNQSVNIRHVLKKEFKKCLENFVMPNCNYCYENNITLINDNPIKSAFYFDCMDESEIITKSENSEKVTSVKIGTNLVYTFLNLETRNQIFDFINHIGLIEQKISVPKWLEEINYFDDEKIHTELEENNKKIDDLINIRKELEIKLESNRRYKKILITNGDELVKIVFDILEELFDIDLSTFRDTKKEDFLFKINDTTFIGEIKGVTSNVKNQHLSQLNDHVSGYLDKLEEDNIIENVKPILIINHQRTVCINERQPINDSQIRKAQREQSLIIETKVLLELFNKYRKNEILKKDIYKMLVDNFGLLNI